MSTFGLAIQGGETVFRPGEEVAGGVAWTLDDAPRRVVVRLFWRTEGKGTTDTGVADELVIDEPGTMGRQEFAFTLPEGPYSFSGRLISLIWGVEALAEGTDEVAREDLVISPTGAEIDLSRYEPTEKEKKARKPLLRVQKGRR